MNELSWTTIRQQVYERAQGCCEYCQTAEANSGQTMHVDHINPQGEDVLENLCLACWNCNSSKHKATTAVDPLTNKLVILYNPRSERWSNHFQWIDYGIRIEGLTSTGRATINRLNNEPTCNCRGTTAMGGRWVPSTCLSLCLIALRHLRITGVEVLEDDQWLG